MVFFFFKKNLSWILWKKGQLFWEVEKKDIKWAETGSQWTESELFKKKKKKNKGKKKETEKQLQVKTKTFLAQPQSQPQQETHRTFLPRAKNWTELFGQLLSSLQQSWLTAAAAEHRWTWWLLISTGEPNTCWLAERNLSFFLSHS